MKSFLLKVFAVWKKNLINHMSNKKKFISQFIFPVLVSLIYYFKKEQQDNNPLSALILSYLLLIYCCLITTSSVRQVITLFINEREENHRQYQMIAGLSYPAHTFANMTYMLVYTSFFLLPFYIILNVYEFSLIYIFYFASLVISSTTLTILLTSFFSDHKIATEVIGLLFTISALLPFMYDQKDHNLNYYLASFMPNSAFSLAIVGDISSTQKWKVSLMALSLSKLYMILYGLIEFRESTIHFGKEIVKKLKKKFKRKESVTIKSYQGEQSSALEGYNLDENISLENTNAIQINNLVKNYKDVKALNKVSLNVKKSEILGLLGRNGAGKTTLVDIITKVTKPTEGNVLIRTKENEDISQSIGICYQHEILYENLTFLQHLQLYSLIKQIDVSNWDSIIEDLGVEQQKNKKVKELSGGNKRKLSIALALLGHPDILIFDEPTSGLDPLSRRNIWKILEDIKKTKSTIILTTHHLDEADYLADRICVIEKGNIIEESTPSQIKNKYGRGHYLHIYHNANESIKFNSELYKKIIESWIPKAQFIDQEHDSVRYFINEDVDQSNLQSAVENLENVDGIVISLTPNNLEQSFLSIIKENTRLEGEEVGESNERSESEYSFVSQLWGVILKNCYCFKMKFFYFYFGNILILTLVYVYQKFMNEKLQENDVSSSQKNYDLYLIQGYLIMTTAFISIPVYEKQRKVINLLKSRGLRTFNYWLGHYIFDIGMFTINTLVIKMLFPFFFVNFSNKLIFLTGSCIILYAYCASMIFQKLKTANNWFTILNNAITYVFLLLIILAQKSFIQNYYLSKITFLKYFIPYYDLIYYAMDSAFVDSVFQTSPSAPHSEIIIYINLIYLLILVFFQAKIPTRIISLIKGIEVIQIDHNIAFENVSKKYGNITALQNVSYKIKNQRVALLGHNGAGKSTSFGLLSCQLTPSEGSVFVQNELRPPYKDVMISGGICYQDDTLWETMTSDQITKVFCYICGVKDGAKERKWLYENMEFIYSNRKFQNLSGGNKRKLCMIISLIGRPLIKYLDECSTGLDPVSRLSMVKTIKTDKTGSIVFTTHSMSEAEDICSRVIIMRKGQVKQDEKIFVLKAKYLNMYMIEVKTSQKTFLKEHFEGQIWDQLHIIKKEAQIYELQISKAAIKLSQILQHLEKLKKKDVIFSYRINEPTLEDIYIMATKQEHFQFQNQE